MTLEATIRLQINRDEDCSDTALRLMDIRKQMLALIGQRNALGGYERMLNVEERLKAEYRALNPKLNKGAQGRRG